MKQGKTKLGIIFGGKSAEHDISILSAAAIYKNLDQDQFEPILIYINREGEWSFIRETHLLKNSFNDLKFSSFIPWEQINQIFRYDIDIYFPILHGPNGEDGKIQALFEMADKPFVGANSFGSALAMDKAAAKILFQAAGLKTADFYYFTANNIDFISKTILPLSYPIFVKPCSMGSSVGISKGQRD